MISTDVRFLGTGDAFGSGGRHQACILLAVGDFQALLDCGATSLLAMRRYGVDPSAVDAVIASHFHGDHFGGVPYLILDGQFRKRTRPLAIVGPAGVQERVRTEMEVAFPGSSATAQRFDISYRELGPHAVAVGPLSVRGLPVAHTPGSEAMGLRVDVAGRAIAYSGDTAWTDALIRLASGSDLFICEAYSFDKRIPYHLDHRTLRQHVVDLGAARIVLTHFGPEMLAHLEDTPEECAVDGMALRV